MKFKRGRKPSPWFVHDIYLRDTWGTPFYVSRRRPFSPRRLFIVAMVLFGLVDLVLVSIFLLAPLLPQRASNTARRAPTRVVTAVAKKETAAPTPTHTRLPTRPPPTDTPIPPTAAPTIPVPITVAPTEPPPANVAPERTIAVDLPNGLGLAPLAVQVPGEPLNCTPAGAMPDVVDHSIKLCGGQTYRPFVVRGERIGVFGDKSSVIRSQGRGYAIIIEGARNFIRNVVIRGSVEPSDANILLCLYPDCKGNPGGIAYGGGILVRAPETTIMESDVAGGVAGIAAERVQGLKLVNNRLDDSSGWGSYNFAVESSFFVGNTLSRDNRACNTEGGYLPTGCESAGWLCIACTQNVIAKNFCVNSGDCYYMNGEGNLNSDRNRFYQNECRASPHNCFEVTFASGNEFVENIARDDPQTGAQCNYPFWIGGSQVIFARNTWNCSISPEASIEHATASTQVPTQIENR